jgi:hypothetical protein
MTTTAPTKPKSTLHGISIRVVEGPLATRDFQRFDTWAKAHDFLSKVCHNGPRNGGYHKCDVSVGWADGDSYALRYDAAHPDSAVYDGQLADRIRKHLEFQAGLYCPAHMTEVQYEEALAKWAEKDPTRRQRATDMLKTLSFTDELTSATPAALGIEAAKQAARDAAAATAQAMIDKRRAAMQTPAPAPTKPVPPIIQAIAAAKTVTPANPSVKITTAQVLAAAAKPQPAKKSKRGPLPPTDMRRRLESLIKGAEAILKDVPTDGSLRDDLTETIARLTKYLL